MIDLAYALPAAFLVNGLLFALLMINLWRLKRAHKKTLDRHELQEAYMLGRSRPSESSGSDFYLNQLGPVRVPQPFEDRTGGHDWDPTTRACRHCHMRAQDFMLNMRRCPEQVRVNLTVNADAARDQADAVALNLSALTVQNPFSDSARQDILGEVRRMAEARDQAREDGMTTALRRNDHYFEPDNLADGSEVMICQFCGLNWEDLPTTGTMCNTRLRDWRLPVRFLGRRVPRPDRELVDPLPWNGSHRWIDNDLAELPGAAMVCQLCELSHSEWMAQTEAGPCLGRSDS